MTSDRAEFERFVREDYAPSYHRAVQGWHSDFTSRQALETRLFGAPFECAHGDRQRIRQLDWFWGRLLTNLSPQERFALEMRSGLWVGSTHVDSWPVRSAWMKELADQGFKKLQAHCAQAVFDAVMRKGGRTSIGPAG